MKPELATDGIYWLDFPEAGTVLTYHSSSGAVSITITADGIPLSSWQALYWRMPFQATGQGGALLNLFVVDKDSTTWTPTGRNILIAVNNPDHGLKWMPGQVTIPKNNGLPVTYNATTGEASWLPTIASIPTSFLTSGSLIGYITSGSLTNYITSASLTNYITSGSLATLCY
jgi:hypothetical protein